MSLLEYLVKTKYTDTEAESKTNEPKGNSGTAVYSSDSATRE